jgi:hypothetical protein
MQKIGSFLSASRRRRNHKDKEVIEKNTASRAKSNLTMFVGDSVEVMLAIEGSMIANALTYPLETIRTRLVVQETKDNEKYEGIVDTLNTIITEEGYLALFKGVEATMLGVIPFELGMHFVRKAVGWYFPEDTWKLLKVSLATIIAKVCIFSGDPIKIIFY